MTPDEYCTQKAARRGSSLHYSLLFAPPAQRRAVTAIYALRRETASAALDPSDAHVARARLAWWRAEIGRLFAGSPEHPVSLALAPHLAHFEIDKQALVALLDGMEMELSQSRYLDFEGLRLYCERISGTATTLAARVFSPDGSSSREYAQDCGLALQLTEIVRRVGRDARRGRIYLPHEDLQRFGVAAHEILKLETTDRFVALMRFEANRARGFYRSAYDALAPGERRAQRPGLILAGIHSTLLDEIERDGFRVLRQRDALTPVRKHWIAWRTWMLSRPVPVRD